MNEPAVRAAIGRLEAVDVVSGSSHEVLSRICRAFTGNTGWWGDEECERLRTSLLGVLTESVEVCAFADRLREAAEAREDVTLWGADYMPYPLDADGVPIHMGDVMEYPSGVTVEVSGFDRNQFVCYYDANSEETRWASADACRHVREQTVEDVLDEMLFELLHTALDEHDRETVRAYAARLALRDEKDKEDER